MLIQFVTIDNAQPMPSPILDDSPQGYHIEERLQVAVKSLANDKQFTVEFRLGDDSGAPGMDQLTAWAESGEPVRVVCSGVTARAFVHDPNKQYRSRGSVKQINGQETTLDTLIVFAGLSMIPASQPFDLDAEVRAARGTFKKQQRDYQQQRNAERRTKMEAELPERVAKMRAQREAQDKAATPAGTEVSGRRRS